MKIYQYIFVLFLLSLFACNDDDSGNVQPEGGSFVLEFDNRVGTTNLNLNTEDYPYVNALGQEFNVTMLRYYISNLHLTREDGTVYEMPTAKDGSVGYYLINEADPSSLELELEEVPTGNYTGITFTIGVDADRIQEGAQIGPLDVTNDMFWSWNAGYIFVKFEGTSPQSTETDQVVNYHVGGYKSDPEDSRLVNNIKEKTLVGAFTIKSGARPQLHVIVDLLKFFASPNTIDFSTNASRHSPAASTDIAENYVNAFVLDHIHE